MSGWLQNQDLADHLSTRLNRVFQADQPIPPSELFVGNFSLNGAGVSDDMAVDGTTPADFRVIVPADKVLIVHHIEWHILDGGIEPDLFGGIAALSNGVGVAFVGADDVDLWSYNSITMNVMWSHLGALSTAVIWQGATIDQFVVSWNISQIQGYVVYLTAGQYVETKISDDLQLLAHFEGTVHGRLIDA